MSTSTPLRRQKIAYWALIVFAVLATIGGTVNQIREHQRIACQAAVNDAFSRAIKQRSAASHTATQGEEAMAHALLDPKATQQSRMQAFAAWADELDELNHAQDTNPLPDASTCH
jgi:hypothetical protein